jgi:hypothetical protein
MQYQAVPRQQRKPLVRQKYLRLVQSMTPIVKLANKTTSGGY